MSWQKSKSNNFCLLLHYIFNTGGMSPTCVRKSWLRVLNTVDINLYPVWSWTHLMKEFSVNDKISHNLWCIISLFIQGKKDKHGTTVSHHTASAGVRPLNKTETIDFPLKMRQESGCYWKCPQNVCCLCHLVLMAPYSHCSTHLQKQGDDSF